MLINAATGQLIENRSRALPEHRIAEINAKVRKVVVEIIPDPTAGDPMPCCGSTDPRGTHNFGCELCIQMCMDADDLMLRNAY